MRPYGPHARQARGFTRIRRCRSAPARPQGFTLLELLIALSLSLLLLAAVYGALNLYWRLQSVGQADVERAQLERAIVRQMELDVGSVIFLEPEAEEEEAPAEESTSMETESTAGSDSSSDSSDSIAGEDTTVVEDEDATDAYVSTSMGIVGDSQTLVLHISRPTRDLSYAALSSIDSVGSHVSDARSVSYFLAAPGGTGLAGAVQPAATFDAVNNSVLAAESGLARLEGDRMAIEFADIALDTETLGSAAQIIAPEVVSLEFQYFDGAAWQTSWDSTAAGRLPQAIEVALGIVDRVAAQEARSQFDAPVPVTIVRHVIAVPLAGPYVPESE